MPRYFFDLHDGVDMIDDEGSDLLDVHQAKIEAARLAGGLLKDDPDRFWSGLEWTIRVRNEAGLTLFELTFFASLAPTLSHTSVSLPSSG